MKTFRRLVATVTTGGLLLSTSPAFAMGIGLGIEARADRPYMETKMENRDELRMQKQNRERDEDDNDERGPRDGSGSMMHTGIGANTTLQERMTSRFLRVINHTIEGFAKFTKRACNASEDSTTSTCLENAKVDLKAKIDAMIDAAFGA